MEHTMINNMSKLFCYNIMFNTKKINNIEELKEYPNDWFYMIKRNKYKKDQYWWWNKRTDEVSNKNRSTVEASS